MTPAESEVLARRVNAWASEAMGRFVLTYGHLPDAAYGEALETFLSTTEARSRARTAAAGKTWDDLDDLLFEACRRAAWRLYRGVRRSGTAGTA